MWWPPPRAAAYRYSENIFLFRFFLSWAHSRFLTVSLSVAEPVPPPLFSLNLNFEIYSFKFLIPSVAELEPAPPINTQHKTGQLLSD